LAFLFRKSCTITSVTDWSANPRKRTINRAKITNDQRLLSGRRTHGEFVENVNNRKRVPDYGHYSRDPRGRGPTGTPVMGRGSHRTSVTLPDQLGPGPGRPDGRLILRPERSRSAYFLPKLSGRRASAIFFDRYSGTNRTNLVINTPANDRNNFLRLARFQGP